MKINIINKSKSDSGKYTNYTIAIDGDIILDCMIDPCGAPKFSLKSLDQELKDSILTAIDLS